MSEQERNNNALLREAMRGNLDPVVRLVQAGAHLEARDRHQRTPLLLALRQARLDVARWLLEHGADTEVRDASGFTPLHVAAWSGSLVVMDLLLDHLGERVDVNTRSRQGSVALHWAACAETDEDGLVTARLLERGAQVDLCTALGLTPLSFAVMGNGLGAARKLLEAGADVNWRDNNAETPLHQAIKNDKAQMVALLIEAGAQVQAQDTRAEAALRLARTYDAPGAAQVIERYQARQAIVLPEMQSLDESLDERQGPRL